MNKLSGSFFGLSTVDLVFDLPVYPLEDTKNMANHHLVCAGGPASNAAVTFAYLGGETTLVSSLGASSLATLARRDITSSGISHVDLSPNRTSDPAVSAIIVSGDSGARTIVTSPSINTEGDSNEIDSNIIDNADVLLFDGYELSAAVPAAKKARHAGKTTVLDGDIFRKEIESLLPFIDIVIYGHSFNVDGKSLFSDLKEYFAIFNINKIAATKGGYPIVYTTENEEGEIPISAPRVLDTLGAGDIFHGAFCYFLGQNHTFKSSLALAGKVAGASVGTFGTRNWMNEYKPSDFTLFSTS
uniref:Sugar or nucleoside kinase, ribokinase family n=1 Tax=Candidatus Kentrum sp. LPFa TaxID=2126335 RepID=A0A450Y1C1_9GAMM|nr:MAG: Sugar or nucleoside kinase, ribokinase family [Candidatus Kentron sp. LPFa]VFK35350.1 MAG: Sugar or nucleoside kinase, ribokinase family [Candidatus Kentron sp. LPFa]